ncbi:MAG: MFS transporter, partial [Candidatus Dormiibacterota bacterium]
AFPFLGDALSYVVSVVLVRSMRGRFRPTDRPARRALWREVIEGVELVIRDPLLRAVVVAAPLLNFGINGMLFTITVALRTHGTAAPIIGLVQAGFALGGIGGALLAPRLQGRLNMWQLGLGLAGVDALLMCIIALLLPSVALVVPLALVPLLAPAANAALVAAMMRRTDEHLRGRVTSTLILAMSGLAAFAPLAGAVLADRWSFRVAVVVFAVATGLAAVPIWFLRRAIIANP